LYTWKVTRRDRAVASGRPAGRQRFSDLGFANEPDGWEKDPPSGAKDRAEGRVTSQDGTRRDRTRAPHRRRARDSRKTARVPPGR